MKRSGQGGGILGRCHQVNRKYRHRAMVHRIAGCRIGEMVS
jgi:hypothetical protein